MTPEQLWQATLGELRLQLPGPTFEARLAQAILQTHEPASNCFTIAVPDDGVRDWLQGRMAATLQRTLTGMTGRPAVVEFAVIDCAESAPVPETDMETDEIVEWLELGVPRVFQLETLESLDWSRAGLEKPQLRDYVGHALDYFSAGIGLNLIGPPGVGKTHIAVGLLKVAAAAGWSARFVGVGPLLDGLRSAFGQPKQGRAACPEHRLLQRLSEIRLLVLDDLRVDALTAWGRDRLYVILNSRWEASRPTVVTSNYSPDELANAVSRDRPGLDDGTMSRLVRTALTICLDGPDYRLEQKRRALATVQNARSPEAHRPD